MPRLIRVAHSTLSALATLAALAAAPAAQAVIIHSGPVNLAIPNTTAGLYVNVVNGTSYSGPDTFPALPGPGANYDFNVFGSSTWSLFSSATAGQSAPALPGTSRGYVAATAAGAASSLSFGALISNGSVFNTGTPSGSVLTTGAPAIFGFRFRNEGSDLSSAADDTVHFGWARVILTAGVPGTLVDYAFESTPLLGIQAGVVPEPGSWALMAGGLLGVACWLRRRNRTA